ncbi:MAG: DNA polymerase III subunit beta [Clostridiales bacterium GWC2_40_7]|nr:MAG: DNA polymerase III subunit beta [Clostridiales bacterium GWC2_40_7]
MKIICSKDNLLEGINIVQKAVSTKTTLPILEGILLEADKDFKLTGNDLEIGIECLVEADIKKPGSIVINSRMLGEIIRRLPDSEVMLEVKENNSVVIDCEDSFFEIKGLSSSGFPALPLIEKDDGLAISQKIVRDMIKQTIFAVSSDENRPILTGSLIECKGGNITIVSIDGFRLALRRSTFSNEGYERNVVIPGKTLNEISKIIQPVDEMMYIYSTNNQVLFDLGKCKVVSRLLEGEYLNYRGILPQDFESKIKVNTKELLASFERAALIISSEERRFPVRLNIDDEKMIITSNSEVGNVREELKIDMEGNNIDIAFNPRYFIEALRVIEEEKINIYFTSSIGPCTVKPIENDNFAYLILPIRK